MLQILVDLDSLRPGESLLQAEYVPRKHLLDTHEENIELLFRYSCCVPAERKQRTCDMYSVCCMYILAPKTLMLTITSLIPKTA